MEILNVLNLDRKGQSGALGRGIAITMTIVAIAVMAPMIFGSDGLADTDFVADAPAWVVTLLTIGAGFALVKLVMSRV